MVEFVSESAPDPAPATETSKGDRQAQEKTTASPEIKPTERVPELTRSESDASPTLAEAATMPIPIRRPESIPQKRQTKAATRGAAALARGREDGKRPKPDEAAPLNAMGGMAGPIGEEATKGVIRDLAAEDRWKQLLQAHLDRRKRYPASALSARKEGVVIIRFSVGADGTVTSAEIQQSSEVAALDAEAIDLLHRASPVPIPPPDVETTVIAPINFSIRR